MHYNTKTVNSTKLQAHDSISDQKGPCKKNAPLRRQSRQLQEAGWRAARDSASRRISWEM